MVFGSFAFNASAQTVHQDVQETLRGEVVEVLDEYEREIVGTDAVAFVQEVSVLLDSGESVTIENEVVDLTPGDTIFIYRTETINGDIYYTYADFERRPVLLITLLLLIGLIVFFLRWQGIRAVLSLAVSVGAILFLLVPALLAGYNPALTTVVIAALILAAVLFGTHGFNARSLIAFGGTFGAVVVTGIIALLSVEAMRLTGFGHDASVYLNFATNGRLDLAGLLLGSIIIGILGVLDDVSITQASVVQQLKAANKDFGFTELYSRAIKVGQDHIGSLVNTLALAYVGVSLPLILLYANANSSFWLTLNQEVVAAELLRIIIGSIGLILAVPATTAVAAWYWRSREVDEDIGSLHHHHH